MIKRTIKLMVITLLVTFMFSITAYAGGRTCGYKGCTRSTEGCHNGTVFCDTHAAAYAREKGYKTCSASGCYDYAKSGGRYCSSHTCHSSKCTNQASQRGGYCSTHKCKYSGCTSSAYYTSGKYKGYCNNHAWQISGKTTTSNKTTTKKKTSSGKKYEMPDCDDYDSYDDFMDDWDGCMPDGSDAEDYWENW